MQKGKFINAMNYLVRHGKSGRDGLTPEGIREAERARDTLRGLGLGATALLLSSDTKRALQTAEIIGAGLSTPVNPSKRINIGGNEAEVVRDLDEFLQVTLGQLGLSRADGQPLVVITHAPLIAVAKGLTLDDANTIENGEVVSYTPGTWNGSYHLRVVEELFAAELNGDRG
jgi:phosphohistidine phosphatase SixA